MIKNTELRKRIFTKLNEYLGAADNEQLVELGMALEVEVLLWVAEEGLQQKTKGITR